VGYSTRPGVSVEPAYVEQPKWSSLILHINFKLTRYSLPETNTPAYCSSVSLFDEEKSFIKLTLGFVESAFT